MLVFFLFWRTLIYWCIHHLDMYITIDTRRTTDKHVLTLHLFNKKECLLIIQWKFIELGKSKSNSPRYRFHTLLLQTFSNYNHFELQFRCCFDHWYSTADFNNTGILYNDLFWRHLGRFLMSIFFKGIFQHIAVWKWKYIQCWWDLLVF